MDYFIRVVKTAWASIQNHMEGIAEANKKPRVVPVAVEAAAVVTAAAFTYTRPKTAVFCIAAVKGIIASINGMTTLQAATIFVG